MKLPLVSIVIPTYNRKDKLARLLESILNSNYPKNKIEIVVIDDASTDGTNDEIQEKFPVVNVIRNEREYLVSGSRNAGIKNTSGKFIFLVDDDNVVDQNTISELIKAMIDNEKIGVAGPIMYYYNAPNMIWCAGIRRNYITSKTTVIGRDEIDEGQFKQPLESEDFPNAFMVRRKAIEEAGVFDEVNFPIHYEESDFCRRVIMAGYKIITIPSAKVWHDMPLPEKVEDKARLFHMENEMRAYYTAKNRIVFHKKYSKSIQLSIFLIVFMPLFTLYYLFGMLMSSNVFLKKRELLKSYLRGTIDGLKWVVK